MLDTGCWILGEDPTRIGQNLQTVNPVEDPARRGTVESFIMKLQSNNVSWPDKPAAPVPSGSAEIKLRPDECVDLFLEGRLRLIQSKDGYRFSIDAILLSEFVTIKEGDVVIDLGTGCGIILLSLLLKRPVGHAFGLEIQEGLASQAMRNALLNGFGDRMGVTLGDIRFPPMANESADVIICNPPYRKVRSGRLNPDPRRAIARHEILASIDDILQAARSLLRKKGRLALIYPSVRLTDILVRLRRFGLEPKRVRLNYPDLESGAKLALIEASLGGRPGLEVLPPLLGQGDFSISSRP